MKPISVNNLIDLLEYDYKKSNYIVDFIKNMITRTLEEKDFYFYKIKKISEEEKILLKRDNGLNPEDLLDPIDFKYGYRVIYNNADTIFGFNIYNYINSENPNLSMFALDSADDKSIMVILNNFTESNLTDQALFDLHIRVFCSIIDFDLKKFNIINFFNSGFPEILLNDIFESARNQFPRVKGAKFITHFFYLWFKIIYDNYNISNINFDGYKDYIPFDMRMLDEFREFSYQYYKEEIVGNTEKQKELYYRMVDEVYVLLQGYAEYARKYDEEENENE